MVVTFIAASAAKKYFQPKEHQNNESEKKEEHNKEIIVKKRPTLLSREGRTLASLFPDEAKQDMNIVISSRFIRPANTSVLKIYDRKMNDQDDDNEYNDNDKERYDDKYEERYTNGSYENRESNSVCYENSQNKKSGKLVKYEITGEEKSRAANYLVHSYNDFEQSLFNEGYDIEIPRPYF
ncbi:7707_t:CDS:2 [Diversispora eburnea]|uniref:7707_t:CDS:1 n=1 Tax=Diversispora eburnea TaxID=1213867 RepID=A0A9N9FB94_9GLOM|nr:7707_t:CDS:2 [Diversispora eburnea]